jgi:hypothetical protein
MQNKETIRRGVRPRAAVASGIAVAAAFAAAA